MRDSMGAAWILSLSLTFTMLFVGFLAISINYSRAFRVKSGIVSRIEENEGYNASIDERLENYLDNEGYSAYGSCDSEYIVPGQDTDWQLVGTIRTASVPAAASDKYSACIYRTTSTAGDEGVGAPRAQYRVVVFFKFDLPIIRYYMQFQVSGESRYLYDFAFGG